MLQLLTLFSPIELFHTLDQNHVTDGVAPFWGSSFATTAAAAVYLLYKLAANLVKESRNVQIKYKSSGSK